MHRFFYLGVPWFALAAFGSMLDGIFIESPLKVVIAYTLSTAALAYTLGGKHELSQSPWKDRLIISGAIIFIALVALLILRTVSADGTFYRGLNVLSYWTFWVGIAGIIIVLIAAIADDWKRNGC